MYLRQLLPTDYSEAAFVTSESVHHPAGAVDCSDGRPCGLEIALHDHNLVRRMGKQLPLRLREVVYTLSPFETTVMSGLWKDIPAKVHKKVSEVRACCSHSCFLSLRG